MYPRDELIKVRILHGRLVVQQHARHGEFRDESAPGGAAAAADVDLVLVLGDQFLRRALLGVDADRLANVIFVFIHRVAAVPIEKSGVDEIGHQQRRQHRAKSRTDARADEHATNGVTSVRTLRDRLQKRVRRVGVVAIHRRQKRVIAPSPKHFFLQGIPRVLARVVHLVRRKQPVSIRSTRRLRLRRPVRVTLLHVAKLDLLIPQKITHRLIVLRH